jgi:hypothetical protein
MNRYAKQVEGNEGTRSLYRLAPAMKGFIGIITPPQPASDEQVLHIDTHVL